MKHLSSFAYGHRLAYLLLLLVLTGPFAFAQAPTWQMAMAVGQTTNYAGSTVAATATDAAGNVYLAGRFSGTVSFGATTFVGHTYPEMFVAKWSPVTHAFVWAQHLGLGSSGEATALAVSGTNVYVAGTFSGAGLFGGTLLTSGAGTHAFLVKLTDAGNSSSIGWAQQAGGAMYDTRATTLAVSGSSVYLTGRFEDFTITAGNLTLTNALTGRIFSGFIAKLADSGSTSTFVWAEPLISAYGSIISAVVPQGNTVYIAGHCGGVSTISGSIFGVLNGWSAFVVKLVDAGTSVSAVWARKANGPAAGAIVKACALAVEGTNVYMAGAFGGLGPRGTAVQFGNNITLVSTAYYTAYVAKLVDAGPTADFAWARQAGGTTLGPDLLQNSIRSMVVHGNKVYVAGAYNSPTAQFGSFTITNSGGGLVTTNPMISYTDIFVARLTDAGSTATFDWALGAGGTQNDGVSNLALSGSTVYVAGSTASAAAFGSLVLPPNPASIFTGYLASFTDPTLLATAAAQSSLSFSLYPNPARATTTVALPALPGAATAALTLRDALGRAVRTQTVPLPAAGLRHSFDLSGLPAGLYALEVRAGTATATRRLVVE